MYSSLSVTARVDGPVSAERLNAPREFDPLPTADYYALAGIFKSTKTMDNFRVVARWHERPLPLRVARFDKMELWWNPQNPRAVPY